VNLADALGVVSWLKTGSEAMTAPSADDASTTGCTEFWCMADGLEHFWEDEGDARWHLLLAVLKSVGHDLDSVMPLDSADDYAGGAVLSFGIVSDFAICLPSLDEMLNDGASKKQAWQTICTNRAFFH
jgi:hypothetical protein